MGRAADEICEEEMEPEKKRKREDGDEDPDYSDDDEAEEEDSDEEIIRRLTIPKEVQEKSALDWDRLHTGHYWSSLIQLEPSPSPSPPPSSPPKKLPPPPPPEPLELPQLRDLEDFLAKNLYLNPDHPDSVRYSRAYYKSSFEIREKLNAKRFRNLRLQLRDLSLEAYKRNDFPATQDERLRASEARDFKDVNPDFEMWNDDNYKDLMLADIQSHPYLWDPYSFLQVFVDPVCGIRYHGIAKHAQSSHKEIDEQRIQFRKEIDYLFPDSPTTMEEDKQLVEVAMNLKKRNEFKGLGYQLVIEILQDHTRAEASKIHRKNAQDSLKKHVSELRRDNVTFIAVEKLTDLCRTYYLFEEEVQDFINEVLSREDVDTDKEIDNYLEQKSKELEFLEKELTITDYLSSKMAVAKQLGL